MRKSLLLLPALLLAATPLSAHAEQIVRTPFTLQGSIAYDCYGCADTATFSGLMTTSGPNGMASVPATGALYVDESCTDTGSVSGSLQVGADYYDVWINRNGAAATMTSFGPGGFYDVYVGGGTFTLDGPAGTCGVPATATLTAAAVPFVNCYCQVAGDRS